MHVPLVCFCLWLTQFFLGLPAPLMSAKPHCGFIKNTHETHHMVEKKSASKPLPPKPSRAPHPCLQSSLSSRVRLQRCYQPLTLWCQGSGGKGTDEDIPAPPLHCSAGIALAGVQIISSGYSITTNIWSNCLCFRLC